MHVTALPVALPSPAVPGHALDAEACCIGQMLVGAFPLGSAAVIGAHRSAHEMFHARSGESIVNRGVRNGGLHLGSAIMVEPNSEHVLETTGVTTLRTLIITAPNKRSADLIRAG